jgi:ketosteroid isomerase-like protein
VTDPAPKPPGRALLRIAGVLTQMACASCLLLGTIAFVLVQQNRSGGGGLAVVWALAALAGLVFGGLMARGGLIAVLTSAALDAAFGITLLTLDHETLGEIMRVLPSSDVEMIGDVLFGAAIAMVWISALCFASIWQALRYNRWLRAAPDFAAAGSTERGFPPPPVSAAAGSLWRTPTAEPAETRSRRRMYFALAGFAIGFGAGIGVLVSSTSRPSTRSESSGSTASGSGSAKTGSATSIKTGSAATRTGSAGSNGKVVAVNTPDAGADPGVPVPAIEKPNVQAFIQDQRAALAKGDIKALIASVAPTAVGFGADADEIAEGRDAIEAQLRHDLGSLPAAGVTIEAKFLHVGEERNHAWFAQDLLLSASGYKARFVITQLAALINGKWMVVAWHWGVPVHDEDAERVAILGTKPVPKPIAPKLAGPKELDATVHKAFASRRAFSDARSDREDDFNFGSAPNERIVGGSSIKRIFQRKGSSEVRLHDGVWAVAGNAWDPAQKDAPYIAFAAINADMMLKTKAATDLTQTFRVLLILVKEGSEWKIVQAQFSHGGPIR